MARVKVDEGKVPEVDAKAAVEAMFGGGADDDEGDKSSNGNPLPFDRADLLALELGRGFDKVVKTIMADGLDVAAEFDELEKGLAIKQALTPEAIRVQLNAVEINALRAHRLVVLAKVARERYRIEAQVIRGAMRDQALAALSVERTQAAANKEKSKQITEADVLEKAAAMFPDEWHAISEKMESAEQSVKHMEKLAELWQRRSWTLASLAG